MSGWAQTVLGPVRAKTLGPALMHEHLLCDLRAPERQGVAETTEIGFENRFEIHYFSNREPANMLLDDDAVAAAELQAFRAAGGGAVVELTVGGLFPQPERLAALATRTGAHIVLGAGFYVDAYQSEGTRALDEDGLSALLVDQVCKGAWGGTVRCGVIGELGCSWPLTAFERRQLRAAARAQAATGAAITIHPGRHPDAPTEIADVLLAAGAAPERCVLGHMDRTIRDRARLVALLRRGLVLEWDFFGVETSHYWMDDLFELPTDAQRVALILSLIREGFGDQIVVSHDICTRTRLRAYGGHGYGHILAHVAPMMRRRGWTDAEIERLLIETPARLLAHDAAAAA